MLKKNECYETEFTGYTSEGLGVAHIDGMAVFAPKAIAGERCRVKILKVTKTVAYGKIEKILTPSPRRVEPVCPYAALCGGCAFQHMSWRWPLSCSSTAALRKTGTGSCRKRLSDR